MLGAPHDARPLQRALGSVSEPGEAGGDSGAESTASVCLCPGSASHHLRDDIDLCDVLCALVSSFVKP